MDNTQELNHISLCSGYGGIDLGLQRALGRIRTICNVEIEAFVIENLVAKVEAGLLDPAPIYSNLKTFPWELFSGRVDILSGGFPCQPFSVAGRKSGDEDPRHLWPYITDGIKRLGRPPIVFFENVEGIISSKLKGDHWSDPEGTPVLLHVLRELERMGYRATAGVFSAREVGAPHQRKRVFIMGCRADLGGSGHALVSGLLERGREPHVGNSESWDGSSSSWRRKPELEGIQLSLRESGATYPAPRGAEQRAWEPPRTTVGNPDSKGLQGPQPNSQRRGEANILTDPTSATQGGRRAPREGNRVDNPNSEGFLRDYNESADTRQEGWQESDGYDAKAGSPSGAIQGEIESSVGRDVDGVARGLDYAQLCYSVDNRTDELRMLGNGVVPDTATRAFKTLWESLPS